jgi:hypothetical protein
MYRYGWKDDIKIKFLEYWLWGCVCGLDSCASRYGAADCCEHGNKTSVFIWGGKCIFQLNEHQLLRNNLGRWDSLGVIIRTRLRCLCLLVIVERCPVMFLFKVLVFLRVHFFVRLRFHKENIFRHITVAFSLVLYEVHKHISNYTWTKITSPTYISSLNKLLIYKIISSTFCSTAIKVLMIF